jgi:hypothetical protein
MRTAKKHIGSGSDRANRSAARHEPKIAFVRPKAGGKRDGKKDGLQMKEYEFEVDVVAVVRVKAPDEEAARKVVPTVLGAPSSVEIRQANEKHASLGVKATVTEVEFTPDKNVALHKAADGKTKQQRRSHPPHN